jgi:hypothetical protein
MSIQEYWKMIPPESAALIIGAIVSLAAAIIGFFVWLFKYAPKYIENRLKQSQEQTKVAIEKAKAEIENDKQKWQIERMELQNQLDQTQSSREMLRLQSSESEQMRTALLKIFDAMREDSKKRDEQHAQFLKETSESYRGINANTASTLELLKLHQELDETMGRKQDTIIEQNNAQERKLTEIQSELDTLLQKVESLTYSRATDSKAIHDILSSLEKVQSSVKHLEELSTAAVVEITPQSDIQVWVKTERKEDATE